MYRHPSLTSISLKCLGCRHSKKKCDNGQPCEPCRKKGYHCIRPTRRARQGRARAHPVSQTIYEATPPTYGHGQFTARASLSSRFLTILFVVPQLPIPPQELVFAPMFQKSFNGTYSALSSSYVDFDFDHHAPGLQAVPLFGPDHNFSGGQCHNQVKVGGDRMFGAVCSEWHDGAMNAPLGGPSLEYREPAYGAPVFYAGVQSSISLAADGGSDSHVNSSAGASQGAASAPPPRFSAF